MKKGDIIKIVGGQFRNPLKGTQGTIKTIFKHKIRIEYLGENAEKVMVKGVTVSVCTYYKKFIEYQIEEGNIIIESA